MKMSPLFWLFAVLGGLVWNGVIDAIVVLGSVGNSPISPQAWLLYSVALGWWMVFIGCTCIGMPKKKRGALWQQREREEIAQCEHAHLLHLEAQEHRARRKAEHDASIEQLCDRIRMAGIVIRMQMGDDLDEEDKAVVKRYQAEGEESSFAVKRYAAVCGYGDQLEKDSSHGPLGQMRD